MKCSIDAVPKPLAWYCVLFQTKTKTDYIVQRTDYGTTGRKFSATIPYVCHLSHKNKSANSERCIGCKSKVHLKLRTKPKRAVDANTKDGFVLYHTLL